MEKSVVLLAVFSMLASLNVSSASAAQAGIVHEEVWATPEEQEKQRKDLLELDSAGNVRTDAIAPEGRRIVTSSDVASPGSEYDVEDNPIRIGDWNPNECLPGVSSTYARHTLGDLTTTTDGSRYLTSYGDAIYWSKGNALPYKNGNYDIKYYPSAAGVDVGMNVSFSIRDLKTNIARTLTRTEWGPNQCPQSIYRYRIADLNSSDFLAIHGNTTAGKIYVRTWVPLVNYNPG